MHDVDVCLILIVHLIQNQLVFIKKLIYFVIHELCVVKHKVKTNNGNSTRKKVWAVMIRKILEQKRTTVVLRFVHYA